MTNTLSGRTLLLLLASAILTGAIVLTGGVARGQFTPGVDFGDPIVDAEGTLVAGENFTVDFPVEEGLFYVIEFIPPGPDNTLTLSGAAFHTIVNADGVEQLNERDADDPPTNWRATFTGDATLRVRGAQGNVEGTFAYRIFELEDDHSDDRMDGTRIEVGEIVDGQLIFSRDVVADLDWFGFDGLEGIAYRVVLVVGGPGNTLTMPRGTIAVFQGDAFTALDDGNQDRAATFTAAVSGDYYIQIAGPQTSVEGTYQLHVEQAGGAPVRVTPNPGGYASGVTSVVVEVLRDGTATPAVVAAAIELDSGLIVDRIWVFMTDRGWVLWSPGPINFGLGDFSGISSIFAVLS